MKILRLLAACLLVCFFGSASALNRCPHSVEQLCLEESKRELGHILVDAKYYAPFGYYAVQCKVDHGKDWTCDKCKAKISGATAKIKYTSGYICTAFGCFSKRDSEAVYYTCK